MLAACAIGSSGSNAAYYLAIAALPIIHVGRLKSDSRDDVPRALSRLLYLGLVPLLVAWTVVDSVRGDVVQAIKGDLLLIAPWALVSAGYVFGRTYRGEAAAQYLVLACALVAGIVSYLLTGYVSPAALMSVAVLLIVVRRRSLTLAISIALPLAAVLLVEDGSRTALLFAALQASVLLTKDKSAPRKFAYLIAIILTLSATVALLSRNELLAEKVGSGVRELAPNEFDINSFGGGSNLRGYEAALVLNWLANADPVTLLFGGGPANYLESMLALGDLSTHLFLFHNALFTYLVKIGVIGTIIIVVSFGILARHLIKIGGIEGGKVVMMLLIASIIDSGSFSYVWITLFFATGVFMKTESARRSL